MGRVAGLVLALGVLAGCAGAGEEEITKEQAADDARSGKADGWSLDYCETMEWYGDGICDWFCPSLDIDCPHDPLGPEPEGEAAKYPFVLAHGFDASPENRWGFYGVKEALEADGHQVFVAEVPPYQSVDIRAQSLATEVDNALLVSGADRVNIIAHSMGGLDARQLASDGGLGYGPVVASITTIGTAHRGTVIADTALGLVFEGLVESAVNALAELWGGTFSELADEADIRGALRSLSEENATAFNATYRDHPDTDYESWAGVSTVLGKVDDRVREACDNQMLMFPGTSDRIDLTLVPVALIVDFKEEPHDGMVTVSSAKHANFRGCIPADHLDQVGQIKDEGADPYTAFDHLRFYRNLAFDRARQGF
jgi:triacylglycerol lipase